MAIVAATTGAALGLGVVIGVMAAPDEEGRVEFAVTAADPVLDGTAPIQPAELSNLSFERARLAAEWLTGVVREDGSFFYEYDPEDQEYDEVDYNEVRHAGTTYSLFQAWAVVGGDAIREAAESAAEYIDASSRPAGDGRAFLHEGRMKLGGQGLAIVALLERRRVTGDLEYDSLIKELANTLMDMEIEDGRYYNSYLAETDEYSEEPDSDYYPGEALLALSRLAAHFPDGPYLAYAERAANFLIHVRDGDIIEAGEVPRVDHWLTLALADLHRLSPQDDYRALAYLQADTMIENQYGIDDGIPLRIGAAKRTLGVGFTGTATRGEALVATWGLALRSGDRAEVIDRYATAARRNIQFQLRVQYTAENTQLFPDPDAAIGGWPQDATDSWIRIDFVQHNLSGLLGVWHLTEEGAIPAPAP